MTKVVIDADLCIGCGACTGVAADSFILNDEGKAEFTPVTVMQHISIISICLIVSWLIYLVSEKHTKTVKNIIKNKMGSTHIIKK